MQRNSKKGPDLIERVTNAMAMTFKRIGFHLASIVAALIISRVSLPEVFYAYIGLICLVPPGFDLRQNRFRVPALFAALLFAACYLVYHVPAAVALLWAGALTWTLQVLIRRLSFGWVWFALPFLLLCFASSLRNYPFPWYAFVACALLGLAVYSLATIGQNKTRLDKALSKTVLLLAQPLQSNTYPESFDAQFRALLQHCSEGLGIGLLLKNKYSELVSPRLEELYPDLSQALKWNAEGFKGQAGNSLLALLAESNTMLEQVLHQEREARLMAGKPGLAAAKAPTDNGPYAEYNASATSLLGKKAKLPPKMQQHLNSLFLSTGSIITCMEEDPGDRPSGTRFLDRYLPAVHRTVDEYIRLSDSARPAMPGGDKTAQAKLQAALAQSETLLERMVQAFQEEHGNLLRNDTMRFTADLNVLDTLLKMDGK